MKDIENIAEYRNSLYPGKCYENTWLYRERKHIYIYISQLIYTYVIFSIYRLYIYTVHTLFFTPHHLHIFTYFKIFHSTLYHFTLLSFPYPFPVTLPSHIPHPSLPPNTYHIFSIRMTHIRVISCTFVNLYQEIPYIFQHLSTRNTLLLSFIFSIRITVFHLSNPLQPR